MTDTNPEPASDSETGGKLTAQYRRQFLKAGAATGLGIVGLGGSSLASADVPEDPSDFHIYLLFGQSNMEGQGEIAQKDRQTDEQVMLLQDKTCSNLGREYGNWYVAEPPLNRCWSGLGPGDYFGKTMAADLPEEKSIGLVPAAVSGADIALFEKGAPIGRNDRDIPTQFSGGYEWMLDLAKKAQEVGTIKGILFHQGETNTGDPQWKNQVQGIVEDLRTDLGIGPVPFLAGEMLYEEYGGCCASHNVEVNKLPNLIENAHVVSAEGLEGADYAHFTAEAYRELGRRYAETMKPLVDVAEPNTPDNSEKPSWPEGATDPDGDGTYEDLNGNGRLDSDDVVQAFENKDSEQMQANSRFYDFNGNGRLDYDDIVSLFKSL